MNLFGLVLQAAFPYVWQLIRERSPEYASLAYLALLGGFTIGALLIGSWVQDVQFKREYDEMRYTPESRIGPATWVGFLVPIGLILFAWTAPFDSECARGSCSFPELRHANGPRRPFSTTQSFVERPTCTTSCLASLWHCLLLVCRPFSTHGYRMRLTATVSIRHQPCQRARSAAAF